MEGPSSDGCQCPTSENTVYYQPFCTRSCEENDFFCQNGGTCSNHVCTCPSNTAGPYCESAPVAYLSPLTVAVNEADRVASTVQVCRQPATTQASFVVDVMPGSAVAQDYFLSSAERRVTLPANTQCSPVTVSVTNDQLCEHTESFTLSLSSSNPSHSIVLEQDTATIFIVDDDSALTISCPSDITVYTPTGTQQTMVSFGPPTVSDISATISSSPMSGSTFSVGTRTVMYTATGAAGCTARCTFTVTVTEDIDECSSFIVSPCVPPDICMNTLGSYRCECGAGYSGDPYSPGQQRTCTDIDECRFLGVQLCASDICLNTAGSYQCECGTGYSGAPYGTGQQRTCTDIDECVTNMHTCDSSTTNCLNQQGFYTCVCKDVFVGAPYIPPSPPTCEADISPPVIEGCPSDQFVTVPFGTTLSTSNWNEPIAIDDSGGTPMLSRSHTPGSSFPVGTTTVTYTFEDPAGNQAECVFDIIAQEDCTVLRIMQCDVNVCSCNEGRTCDSQTGRCEASCNIFECPAVISSQPLSQVNPQSSVEISCILEGTTVVVNELDIRLSRSEMAIDNRGIGMGLPVITDSRRERTFTVSNVSEEDQFFCILTQFHILSAINVTGFLHKLPVILDEPTEVTRSNTSITISWRPWDPAIDVGDPPVVAYIPYYRMDPSQDWINGSVIPANLSLEFTASNLESDRNYTFSIAAVREGEGGEGPRGPPVTIKTLCTVPPELLPSSVSTTLTPSGDVSVSWKSPENVDCSTGITQFTVYYDIEGDITNIQKAGATDATSRSFIVDGSLLESGTTYNFYVTVTTDQEGAFSGATEDSQLMFNVDTGSSAVYLVVLVIPFLLLCIVVVIIFRRYQKKARNDDVRNANYDNAGVTVDPEDYIALDEKSRNKGTEEYQGLSEAVRYDETIQGTAVTSSIDKSQKRREQRQSNYQYEDVNPDAASRKLPTVPQLDRQSQDESEYEVPEMFNEYAGVYVNAQNVVNPSPPTPIKVTDFKKFMTRGRSEVIEEIIQQFMALQPGKQYPWNAALKLQNKPKNFFKSLLPYDHSRVKLDTVGSSGSSDYINASYLKSHQGKVSFIAAQGPRDGTKDDFWKMVWQEGVEAIVMLVDKSEMIKQQQYWPSKVNRSLQYGDITVLLMETTGFKTHTVRKMNVLKGNERVHTLKHYEIPCWRYGGVPSEPADLISVIKQIKTNQKRNKHLLVHCSNGVGATGTFIALYDLMDVIKTKKEFSVFDVIKGMRKDRIDMVLNKLQYLFIFDALLEAMLSPDSQVSCDQLKKLDPPAIKKKAKKEFQVLKHSHQTDPDISLLAGSSPQNKHKNRFQNLIPMDEYRPVLSSTGILFGFNDYVNATIVKDISEKDFIMTQSPLPSIFEDFWRLVLDYDCTSIIMLNTIDDSDESLAEYWPDGHNAAASHGLISVTCKKIDESEVFTKRQFQVNHKRSQKSILVDHFSFHGWTGDKRDVSKLIEFIKYTKPKGPGPGLVHCINGVGLSAVYVTVVSELERMENEGTIDVYGTVKKLRKKCPAAIQTEEEYCLCYQLLRDHLNNPDEYAVVF